MTQRRRSTLVLASLLFLPAIARGQTIRGAAIDRVDSLPVAGVVVLLVDSAGTVVARSLSNERGEFRLSALTSGTYRVRTLRIGFRPAISQPLVLGAGEDLVQRLVLTGVPFSLDTVRVVGRAVCRIEADSAAVTYAIWEQARTALTAAQLTAQARTIGATVVTYERILDRDGRRVREQRSAHHSGFSSKPWRSLSADTFRRIGYVSVELNGWITYYGPDLDVLLSSVFLEDHCFRISRSPDRSRLGIAFEPARDRSHIPEIRGTLWLDRKSSELRSMDFRYVNISDAQEIGGAGGEMEFVRMTNGAWAISRWHIRMPLLSQRLRDRAGFPGETPTMETRVTGIKIGGGDLALVTRGQDTLWSRPELLAKAVGDSPAPAPPMPPPSAPGIPTEAVPLKPVVVAADRPVIAEFEERRALGAGHFITRAELEKHEARKMAEVLSQVPGIRVVRGVSHSWLTGRAIASDYREPDPASRRLGARPACYVDVYVDGALMYAGRRAEPLFEANSISPALLEGVEFYAGTAQAPVKYGRTGSPCGVLLLWTRRAK